METTYRIEPCHLTSLPPSIADLVAEISAAATLLSAGMHPKAAASLAGMVRMMNCYYSNLIEGHNTRPREIERALSGDLDSSSERRNLQLEALAHIRVQEQIDHAFAAGRLKSPASVEFLKSVHRRFYAELPEDLRVVEGANHRYAIEPGAFRSSKHHDVSVGRHVPPSSAHVEEFMAYFEQKYRLDGAGQATRIISIATAHHRFNFIHPFPDGNGRVSRLMSHALALRANVGAHSLWSISRGLARGLKDRGEYRQMMDLADSARRGDTDGRGNLSLAALEEFVDWFLRVALDQINFMTKLFDLNSLGERLRRYATDHLHLKNAAADLLEEILRRGELARGDAPKATGLGDRASRAVLSELTAVKLLGSDSPKGPVSLRFPDEARDVLFPRLFLEQA